jgi:hypothetical protein
MHSGTDPTIQQSKNPAMPRQMVLGPWHEMWEAFLYYLSNQAAMYDRTINNGEDWPELLQKEAASSYKISVNFSEAEARTICVGDKWSHGFETNVHYDNTFEYV